MNYLCKKRCGQRGVTLTELIIAVSIIALLAGLVTVNLFNIYGKTALAAVTDSLLVDLKSQQLKAMIGDTDGQGSSDSYGIYFETNRYVLFKGLSYSAADPLNFPVNLDANLNFINIVLPSAAVVFVPLSGEWAQFAPGADSVTIKETSTGEEKTIKINQYGVAANIF